MNITVDERYQRLIEDKVRAGEFISPQAVVDAALHQMLDPLAHFPPGRLNAMIEEGMEDIRAGRVYSAEEVDERLAQRREEFLRKRALG